MPARPDSSKLSSASAHKGAAVVSKITKLPAEEILESCGTTTSATDDDEMEMEEMFVKPHESFEFATIEWGGPRRGGRLPEPTRYGDWERKGRCSDF
jgi:hypothetical protein